MIRYHYKKLKIWQLELEISKDISDILDEFPTQEKYNLGSQLSRCSISTPSDIAEGSFFELGTQLLIASHKKYITIETLKST